jgi:hypothetical protein
VVYFSTTDSVAGRKRFQSDVEEITRSHALARVLDGTLALDREASEVVIVIRHDADGLLVGVHWSE